MVSSLDPYIPEHVQDDPWLMFHGSSNVFEDEVLSEGLSATGAKFSRQELLGVAKIFEALSWAGEHPGGYAVLRPFSFDHDSAHERGRPIYLAESALRAANFATADFSGGEICRALHYSFADIRRYIDDEGLREEHARKCEARPGMARLSRGELPSVDFVRQSLADLSEIRDKVAQIRSQYEYGVVYALRITVEDLSAFGYHPSMGIKCFRAIAPDEIQAMYPIPREYEASMQEQDEIRLAVGRVGIVNEIRRLQR